MVLLIGVAIVSRGHVFAQEGTPAAAAMHPVAIHHGTCDSPTTAPAFGLGETRPIGSTADDEGETVRGVPPERPVLFTEETINATFDDLFDAEQPHLIAIHESAQTFGTMLACGQLGGVEDDGRIVVALRPVGESRLAGVAVLDEDESGFLGLGETEIQITVYLFAVAEPTAPEVATPEPIEPTGAGYAHPEWLVDGTWVEEHVAPGAPAEPPLLVIGVDAFDQTLPAIPGATRVDWANVAPPGTSEAAIAQLEANIQRSLLPLMQTPYGRNLAPGDMVLLYDDGSLEATCIWWALDYVGHGEKHLLNGGAAAWLSTTSLPPQSAPAVRAGPAPAVPTPYPGEGNPAVLATLVTARESLEDPNIVLVDTRSPEAYAAGHLPGAVNVPAAENVEIAAEDEPRHWKDGQALREIYAAAGVAPEARVITYGASGDDIGAYVAYFTLRLLGYEEVAVYPGGWAEWASHPELPRTTGDQP